MAEYGFTYRSFSTYGTTRNIETRGPVIKPFVPSKDDNGIGNKKKLSEGYVTKKTIVPITSGPYANHDSASATETYNTNHHPSKGDDETSPVRGYPRKVDEGGSRPQRFSPVAPHPTPTPTGANNGYGGDYVTGNREGRKPVIGGGTIRNNDGSYNNGTNYGYGDREGRKPVGISSTNKKNPNYDHEYPISGYGGEDYNNRSKEGYYNKPSRNGGGNYDHDYGNKEAGYKPTNNGYDYGGSNKEGPRKPIGHYDDHDYNRSKEGYKPTSLIPVGRNNNKGGYGFGNGNNNNDDKEQYRRAPFGSTNTNYSDDDDGIGGDRYNKKKKEGQMMNKPSNSVWNRPRIIPGWTAAPRKGTQLSEPTHDIDKALEYLKIEAAKHDRRPNSRLGAGDLESTAGNSSPNGADTHTHTIDRIRRPGGATWPLPSTSPTRVKVTDHDGRYAAAAAAAADYIYSDDDDDDHDHDAYTNTRRYGGVIDSDEAEKKFKGTRV